MDNIKKKSVKGGLIKLIVSCVIIVALIVAFSVGNAIAFKYESVIDSALVKPVPLDEETTSVIAASGQKMAQRIVEEGTVLLKNENETLPLSTEETPRVNVFGWHSIDWL